MIRLSGAYLDGLSSAATPVSLVLAGETLRVFDPEGRLLAEARRRECRLSEPLGRTARVLRLPAGAVCELDDGPEVEQAARVLRGGAGLALADRLERHWRGALACLVALALAAAAAVRWGVPAAAERAAALVPDRVADEIGLRALALLDRAAFAPSRLEARRRLDLERAFRRVCGRLAPGAAFELAFRRSPALGPNAFALPARRVVVTDELVALARTDRELEGVFAHEVAHGLRRHALRSSLQNAGVFLVASAVLGDVASLSSAAAALPAILAQSGYSRAFEREADAAAGRYLVETGGTTKPLRELLLRVADRGGELPAASLLGTHPPTADRVRRLEDVEKPLGARDASAPPGVPKGTR